MARRYAVAFDDDPPIDKVVFAVAPIDAFSGRVVLHGVDARIQGLPDRPIRNRSGLLVFVNLPDRPKYTVHVTAEAAGYFDPALSDFVPESPAEVPLREQQRRLDVLLLRRPTFAFDEQTTLVSGVVLRGDKSVEAAQIEAMLPQGVVPRSTTVVWGFRTSTDARGAFALALRLPPEVDSPGDPVPVIFQIKHGEHERQFEKEVKEGHRHVFQKPIDLSGNEDPELSTI